MEPHAYFEELSVLSVTGDISSEESCALQEHLRTCPSCRQMLVNCETTALFLSDAAELSSPSTAPVGMRERFQARLHSHASPTSPFLFSLRRRATVAASVLLIAVCSISFYIGRRTVRLQVQTPVGKSQPSIEPQATNDIAEQLRHTQEQLRSAIRDLAAARKSAGDAQRSWQQLEAQVRTLEDSNGHLQSNLADRDGQISKLRNDIEQLKTHEQADHVAATISEAEVRGLQESEARLTTQLEEARRVERMLSDAKDLIVDRNLHTLDVRDTDRNGKERRAFGRIFYTEGHRFDFYAWDLADPKKLNAHTSFYLWGETRETAQRVVSLGQFHVDSAADGRWLLRVDPRMLTQITSVFVTEEPDNATVKEPTGQRILLRELTRGPRRE